MGSSDWIRNHFLLLGLLVTAVVFLSVRFVKNNRRTIDRWSLRLPKIGTLVLATQVARFSRTLGVLLSSGTPLQKAMEVSEATVTNQSVRDAVAKARIDVTAGESLSRSLKNSKVFPVLAIHMIAVGERSGKLDDLLVKLAEGYELETDQSIATLTTLIEPVMILFIGGIVLFMVLSVLLPIFEMSQAVQ